MCIWWWNLWQISLWWCWYSNPPLLDGMQHLSRHGTYKTHHKKSFSVSTIKTRWPWAATRLISFLSCTPPTRSWSAHNALHTQHPLSHTYSFWGPAVSAAPGTRIFAWARNREGKRDLFSRWGNGFFFSKCNSLPPHVCNSFLPPTAASWNQMYCILYIHSKAGRMYTPTILTLLSYCGLY